MTFIQLFLWLGLNKRNSGKFFSSFLTNFCPTFSSTHLSRCRCCTKDNMFDLTDMIGKKNIANIYFRCGQEFELINHTVSKTVSTTNERTNKRTNERTNERTNKRCYHFFCCLDRSEQFYEFWSTETYKTCLVRKHKMCLIKNMKNGPIFIQLLCSAKCDYIGSNWNVKF